MPSLEKISEKLNYSNRKCLACYVIVHWENAQFMWLFSRYNSRIPETTHQQDERCSSGEETLDQHISKKCQEEEQFRGEKEKGKTAI